MSTTLGTPLNFDIKECTPVGLGSPSVPVGGHIPSNTQGSTSFEEAEVLSLRALCNLDKWGYWGILHLQM